MNRKELAYRVFVDCWRLLKRYGFKRLNESQWEDFIECGNFLLKRYRDTESEFLFRYLFMAISDYFNYLDKIGEKNNELQNTGFMGNCDG